MSLTPMILAVSLVAAPDVDPSPVVRVYANMGVATGRGAGFFISDRGEILTAYHVVHGAQRIDVFWSGRNFTDVLVLLAHIS